MSVADVVVLLRLCDQLLVMSLQKHGHMATIADWVGHHRSSPKQVLVHAFCIQKKRGIQTRMCIELTFPRPNENLARGRRYLSVVGGI